MPARAIDRTLERRLAALVNSREPGIVQAGRRGLEREALRVTPAGRLARTPHPRALGSALTHPSITTDFSESLIELVTPTFHDNASLQEFLLGLHAFVVRHLDGELLWASSMPCEIAGQDEIPIARYGSSHAGQFKHIYRRGLKNRYGAMMQAIAGVHFNYSFPNSFWPAYADLCQSHDHGADFISARYIDLLRNFRRHGWLLSWLFGASPALCSSFLPGQRATGLQQGAAGTLLAPCGTSLRMSDLGYRNRDQSAVTVSVNALSEYLRDLRHAVNTPHAAFAKIGVKVDGEYRQLNANILQIENEYYSSIRPKRVPRAGEHMSQALSRRGVEYIEVRALDLNPYEPTGVSLRELHLVEAFLLLLLLQDSPPLDSSEQEALDRNFLAVARDGREPGLVLERNGRRTELVGWAAELLEGLQATCELLDGTHPERPYSGALNSLGGPGAAAENGPAARWLREMRENRSGFADLALSYSRQHRDTLAAYSLSDAVRQRLEAQAIESLEQQSRREAADTGSFDDYLRNFFESQFTE
ncbi:MAG TPA: glutamate--cysteine ligase [Steroidobacteraceae bacterium]|nr:glutamate--cysteine ligase [Steroidobacteraceae bacterium]